MSQTQLVASNYHPEVTYSLEPLHNSLPVHGVRFSSQNQLASVGFDGSIHLWSLDLEDSNFSCDTILPCSKRPLLQVDFSPSGKLVAAAGADGLVHLADTESFSPSTPPVSTLQGHESYVNGVCFAGEDALLTSSDDSTVRAWDVRSRKPTALFELPKEATSVAFSPLLPNQLFCGSLDNQVRCFDPRNPSAPVYALEGHRGTVSGLSLSPDSGRELVSAAFDGTVRIWDVSPFCAAPTRLVRSLPHGTPGATDELLRVSHTPGGKHFGAGSGAGSEFTVCLWDRRGNPFKAFKGHSETVIEVSFHPRENFMASCGMDGRLIVGSYF